MTIFFYKKTPTLHGGYKDLGTRCIAYSCISHRVFLQSMERWKRTSVDLFTYSEVPFTCALHMFGDAVYKALDGKVFVWPEDK